jgi:hypothetical protein
MRLIEQDLAAALARVGATLATVQLTVATFHREEPPTELLLVQDISGRWAGDAADARELVERLASMPIGVPDAIRLCDLWTWSVLLETRWCASGEDGGELTAWSPVDGVVLVDDQGAVVVSTCACRGQDPLCICQENTAITASAHAQLMVTLDIRRGRPASGSRAWWASPGQSLVQVMGDVVDELVTHGQIGVIADDSMASGPDVEPDGTYLCTIGVGVQVRKAHAHLATLPGPGDRTVEIRGRAARKAAAR